MTPEFPSAFTLKLLQQETVCILAFRRLVETVQARTEQQLRETKGIHLEAIRSQPPFHAIRLDKGPRAKVLFEGETLIFVDLNTDHEAF